MKLSQLSENWKHNMAIALGLAVGNDSYAQEPNKAQQQESSTSSFPKFTAKWEGFSSKMYIDTTNNRTIGYGFNLERRDAPKILSKYSLDYDEIIGSKQEMSKDVSYKILVDDIELSVKVAKNFVANFDKLPTNVKEIVVDLAYNLGPTKIREFKKFKAAIEGADFNSAANELQDSKWAKQTGHRAKNHIKTLRELN